MKSDFEKPKSKLEQFFPAIKNEFADKLDEYFTNPRQGYRVAGNDAEKVRQGEKIRAQEVDVKNLLIMIGQKFRLNPDEIDSLMDEVFTKE